MTKNEARHLADDIADSMRNRPSVQTYGFSIRILNPEGAEDTYGLVLTTYGHLLTAIPNRETWEDVCTSV